jgi:aminobenzoyl-glutamate transport protein
MSAPSIPQPGTGSPPPPRARTRLERVLDAVERAGNKLPDPALLFVWLLALAWVISWALSGVAFDVTDPRTKAPLQVLNLFDGRALTTFLGDVVRTFVNFPPLGVVLVAMLGIGVAEHTGFVNAGLRGLLQVTRAGLLTPMLVLVAILSHLAVDAGYVLVIPLGGVIFHAAGRHPLAGIAAAFAGVSGGFSASFVPVSLDPLLAGITQQAARILAPAVAVNPLNNWYFTAISSVLVILLAWWLTDRVIEPRLQRTARVDGDLTGLPTLQALAPAERRALGWGVAVMVVGLAVLAATAWPASSAWRTPAGALTVPDAPLMKSIVPLVFLLFLLPGIVFGVASGSVKTHRDVIAGMSKAMSGMGYYVVLAFFAAQFIQAFNQSNLGALLALEGAEALRAAGLPNQVTIVGIVLLSCLVNLFVGSASAKWALLAPLFVPMLMQVGISPDLTQAAYRVGDSTTNIVTPLMPYFPLIVVYCQRYVKGTGIGTVIATMLPYSVAFLLGWSALLLGLWAAGVPLGVGASYGYAAPG